MGRTRLLMISGPIAAGKSTLAAAVGELLRSQGRTVARTDLDTVAEMALPTLPDWEWAHRIHADVVGAWLRTGIELVVDEGTSTPEEVRQVLAAAPPDCGVFHVVLTADYAASLARAQGDPGRGLSRDPDFLRRHHDAYAAVVDQLPCDLRIHVEGRSPEALAAQVVATFGRHRPGARGEVTVLD